MKRGKDKTILRPREIAQKHIHTARIRLPWNVADENLCVRCGFCLDICPYGLIEPDDNLFPKITEADLQTCTECGLCMRGCAADVDFPKLSKELFGQAPEPLDALGVAQNICVGYSLYPDIRSSGSSGGVVTQLLLYMLRKGLIDQALVCGMDKERPWEVNPILAETEEEILESAQSKYTIVPQMRRIKQIMDSTKRVAIVGIPCQIHAYRKFALWQKEVTDRVQLVVGLGCNSTLEIEATQKLLQIAGIRPEELRKLEYRGGKEWPGGIQATLKNEEIRSLHGGHIKQAFNYLTLFYKPERCLTCIDYSGEFSDLTVMDPWIRDQKGQFAYADGYSLIIVRNEKAQKILDQAVAEGNLFVEALPRGMLQSQFDPVARNKKILAPIRIRELREKGHAFPRYNIDFPRPAFRRRLGEKLDSVKRILGNWEWTRDLGMRLLFSQFGNDLIMILDAYKERKHALRNWLKNRWHKRQPLLDGNTDKETNGAKIDA